MPQIVLASTSPYRRELLARLGLEFLVAAPSVDESRYPQEMPRGLVLRLAEAKARAVAEAYPEALVIGADQVACLGSLVLGKPRGRDGAVAQLEQSAGRAVELLTGLCLIDGRQGSFQVHCESFRVHFRRLTRAQIEAYVDREQPFNCAGSFKSEGLGIALFERLEGDDPTAVVGLPLIQLTRMLGIAGVDVLNPARWHLDDGAEG